MDEKRARLGTRLRELRQKQHMTQEQLAERAGLHPTYVAKIEAGLRLPSLDALDRLAAAVNVPMARIVEAMDEPAGPLPPLEDRLIEELVALLQGSSTHQICFVRDFLELLKRHNLCHRGRASAWLRQPVRGRPC